jgi:hypothetical protein
MKGPSLGMASAPIPTIQPRAPPNTAPPVAPVAAPPELGVLLVSEILGSFFVRKENRYVVLGEASRF